ncbi:MAG: zf-HC2 domain-containing protein [Jiangellaceae bacterium]
MTGGHLGAALIAEYDEGLLPDRAAADVAAHLANCPSCTETHRRLADVSHQLAAAPPALPTPADVAARVDDALSNAESSRSNSRVGSFSRVRPWRARMPTLLAAAAAVAAVAFAGYVVGTGSTGGDDSQTTVAEGGADVSTAEGAQAVPDAGGDADTPAPQGRPLSPQDARTALTEQIRQIVSGSTATTERADQELTTGACGATLAAEVGRDIIGTAPTDLGAAGAVLVVTTASTDETAQGWVLPTCDATASDVLTTLTVPVE